MRGEELEALVLSMREKLGNAKMQRNTLQVENDMIHDFYSNTRDEIKDLSAQVRNFDSQM